MSITQRSARSNDHSSSFIPTAVESLNIQSKALSSIAGRLGIEFDDAVRLILGCKGRVIVSGMGKSGIVGKKIAATFASFDLITFRMPLSI